LEKRRYLITRPAIWAVKHQDPLLEYYRKQELLLTEGTVAWGALVQANSILFGPGMSDAPATMIYSAEPAIEVEPERLATIASRLFSLRGFAREDPAEQQYGNMLEKESERAMGIAIPASHAEGLQIFSTTVMIRRCHLPGRILRGKLMPVLMHPASTAVMIVPSEVWPESLACDWRVRFEDYDPLDWQADLLNFSKGVADRFRKIAAKGFGDSYYVRVYVDEPTDGYDVESWHFAGQSYASPLRHIICDRFGQKFLISRSQLDLFMGFGITDPRDSTAIMEKSD
jgi:hypothetical protein